MPWIMQLVSLILILWIVIVPVDSAIQHLRLATKETTCRGPRAPIFPIFPIMFIGSYKEPIFQ